MVKNLKTRTPQPKEGNGMNTPLLTNPAYLDFNTDETEGLICVPYQDMAVPIFSKTTGRAIIIELQQTESITPHEKQHLLDSLSNSGLPHHNELKEVLFEARHVVAQCNRVLSELIAERYGEQDFDESELN